MGKNNQKGKKPQGVKHKGEGRKPFPKHSGKPKRKNFGKKKILTEDQLDRDLEMYWGNEIGSKHLDNDMDDYWKGKKEEPKP